MTYFFAIRMQKQNTSQKNRKYTYKKFAVNAAIFCAIFTKFVFP